MKLINSSQKIYVAGHNGMAGSAISRALYRKGYNNQINADRSELDLESAPAVFEWMMLNRPEIVIIAAAKVGGIYANSSYPFDYLISNLKIQNNLFEASWKAGVKRLLFLGSSCIYPKLAQQPITEESLLSSQLESSNQWYAIAKIAGIKLGQSLRKQHGFDAISLMPTNLYGPGDNYHPTNSHVLPALIRRFHEAAERGDATVTCWGTGSPLREFLHVDDLGEACVFALEHWDPSAGSAPLDDAGQPLPFLNVGTGLDLTIRQLAEAVARATGFSGEIIWDSSKPDGTPKKQLDVSRLASLGWTARIPLEDGLVSTVALFREQLNQQLVRL